MKKLLSRENGFTLMEAIVVCLILVAVIVGILSIIAVSFSLNEGTKNTVIALNDASAVLERIRNLDPFESATVNAYYPDGSNVSGNYQLAQETVRVDYANLLADPLMISVTVGWMDKKGPRSETISTLMTNR